MTELKTNSQPLNIKSEVFEQGKRITNIDEIAENKKIEIIFSEEVDASNKPKVVAIDSANSTELLIKNVSSYSDIIVGVVPGQRHLINSKTKIITKGYVKDNTLIGGTLNQDIYCTNSGELTLAVTEFRIGKLINVSPPIAFVEIGQQSGYELGGSQNDLDNLEKSLRKISYFSNKVYRFYNIGLSNVKRIAYGNGLFVAISSTPSQNCIATSPDGENWTVRSLPSSPSYPTLESISYGNGYFIIGGIAGASDRLYYSQDGINWTGAGYSGETFYDIAYHPVLKQFQAGRVNIDVNSSITFNLYASITTRYFTHRSTNQFIGVGINNNVQEIYPAFTPTINNYLNPSLVNVTSIAYRTSDDFLIASFNSNIYSWKGADIVPLTTWQNQASQNPFYKIKYFEPFDLFIGLSSQQYIFGSDGRAFWNTKQIPNSGQFYDVAFSDNGLMVIVNGTQAILSPSL